ncbi:hypothetical protein RSAG8_02823, partial [Rhizoctonia solani AG-8 WAC10335]
MGTATCYKRRHLNWVTRLYSGLNPGLSRDRLVTQSSRQISIVPCNYSRSTKVLSVNAYD